MKIENVKVYDLEESIIASGYPMRTDDAFMHEVDEKDIKRCKYLTKAIEGGEYSNGAHGQYLTGIRVAFDLTFSNKAWVEAERYRFLEFVSSQSSMHRITKFNLDTVYNKYVDPRIIDIMKEKVQQYNALQDQITAAKKDENSAADVKILTEKAKELYLQILYSNPAGFEIKARLTTNYRCLRNIYIQRKDHRLPEWREFCEWIEALPMFKELCLKEEKTNA